MSKKNQTYTSVIIAIFAAIFSVGGRYAVNHFGGNELEIVLNKSSMELNKSLPVQIDANTELFSTLATNNEFIYNYRLVNSLQSELDMNLFDKNVKPLVFNQVCSTPDARKLLNKDVIMKYRYHDKVKVFIQEIEITKNQCDNL